MYKICSVTLCDHDDIFEWAMRESVERMKADMPDIVSIELKDKISVYVEFKTNLANAPILASYFTFVFNDEYNKCYLFDLGNYGPEEIPEEVLKRDMLRKHGFLFSVWEVV